MSMVNLYVLDEKFEETGGHDNKGQERKTARAEDLHRARTSLVTMTYNCNMSIIQTILTILTYNTNYMSFEFATDLS
jgi:hypothetical protein